MQDTPIVCGHYVHYPERDTPTSYCILPYFCDRIDCPTCGRTYARMSEGNFLKLFNNSIEHLEEFRRMRKRELKELEEKENLLRLYGTSHQLKKFKKRYERDFKELHEEINRE